MSSSSTSSSGKTPVSDPNSRLGSTPPSADAVRRAAVVTHGRPQVIGAALARLEKVAAERGVELVFGEAEVAKHKLSGEHGDSKAEAADLVVVLGGDGTMLRALNHYLGRGVPVIGVNFGRVGFLTSIDQEGLETGLVRAFAGEYRVLELPTLDVEVGGARLTAVNDMVAASSELGRMVELSWEIGAEDLGTLPCDGLICCTPTGSTAYNLSNGGPVLVWGLDALAVTFVAAHALHARPLVVPRGRDVVVRNKTVDVEVTVLVDGRRVHVLGTGDAVAVRIGDACSQLATLPEATFFRRYRETFGS